MIPLDSLFQSLGLVDCALLKHQANNTFTVIHAPVGWFYWLFPDAKENATIQLENDGSFIHNFLIDAQEFWLNESSASDKQQIQSGIWKETIKGPNGQSKEVCLECIAAIAIEQRFLIINNAESAYEQKQSTLQTARETLLSHDKMQAQHDILSERLSSVIKRNETVLDLHLPVEQAIQNADFGVVIIDTSQRVLFSNPCAYDYFELDPFRASVTPFAIIKQLIEGQYPESVNIFQNAKTWNGELYWHCPPNFHKWLQVSVQPVRNNASAVAHWVITLSDTTRIKHLLQKNENLILNDALTGLHNRQYMWKFLDKACTDSRPLSLLFIDIIRFKRINELYGHASGDKILQDVALHITEIAPKNSYVARIGSARFALIIHFEDNLSNTEQHIIVNEVSAKLNERLSVPFLTQSNAPCLVETNTGIAFYPQDSADAESFVKAADIALKGAVTSSSKTKFYSKAMLIANEERLQLEEKLKSALENDEFRLFLQPIIDTYSERIVKAEALLRWKSPKGEDVSPDIFIPIAEQTGLIIPLGNWVIKQVCGLLSFLKENDIDIKLAINLSPKQVSDRYLFDFIKATTTQSGVDAKRLELELTEGVLVNDYEKASNLLNSLRDMGVSIAIDDFGTGYSSLSYLKHLPIDHLKIDRSFIRDIDISEDDRAIVLAIIAMAKQLRLSVIAEGVETEKQRDFLHYHDCQSMQGYFYSKPVPADEFIRFFRKHNK
jgi:diguanylate cyclase (GGDEF)-like protein